VLKGAGLGWLHAYGRLDKMPLSTWMMWLFWMSSCWQSPAFYLRSLLLKSSLLSSVMMVMEATHPASIFASLLIYVSLLIIASLSNIASLLIIASLMSFP
jgi:hypothetical protein